MTLKYIYTFGDEYVGGFQPAYAHCHAPLDNVMVEQLAKYGFPALTVAWSRMDYDDYFNRQEWIRRKFAPVPPLDVEFYLWMGRNPHLSPPQITREPSHAAKAAQKLQCQAKRAPK